VWALISDSVKLVLWVSIANGNVKLIVWALISGSVKLVLWLQ
jgi:hypothetical protein